MNIKNVNGDDLLIKNIDVVFTENVDIFYTTPENWNILRVLDQRYVSLGKICYKFFPREVSVADMCHKLFPREGSVSDIFDVFFPKDGLSQDRVCTITSEDVLECFQTVFRAIKCGNIKNHGLFAEQDVINEKEASLTTMLYCYKAILLMIRENLLPIEIYFFLRALKKIMILADTVI